MAEFVLKNCVVRIGTSASPTTMTNFVRSVTITYSAELHDRTAMRSSARKRIAGLKDGSIAIEFNQDFASTSMDKTLYALLGSTANRILVKPTTADAAAGNPRYYGNVILGEYSPITGSVGDLSVNSVTFQMNGLLTRSETS